MKTYSLLAGVLLLGTVAAQDPAEAKTQAPSAAERMQELNDLQKKAVEDWRADIKKSKEDAAAGRAGARAMRMRPDYGPVAEKALAYAKDYKGKDAAVDFLMMAVNLDGVFYTFRRAAGHMRERSESGDPFGRLVATASLAVVSGQARGEHYAATKGALIPMIKALAVEYARHGVTAHTLLPGWVETGMTEQTFAWEKFANNVMPRIPMRRWGQPEDFAAIACYIMCDASNWHTAETFLIDGGYANF